jgi:hypothetical protein
MAIILEVKHAHPAANGTLVDDLGRAFVNVRGGLDVECYVIFPFDAQGLVRLTLQPRDISAMRECSDKGVPLKALFCRRYTAQGAEKVHWIEIGRGMISEQGAQLELFYQPPMDKEGRMRFILRPRDQPVQHSGGPVQPQQPAQGQPSYGQSGQPAYGRQQPAQGQASSFRPQHRDGLGQGGQQSFGGVPPPDDKDEIPF